MGFKFLELGVAWLIKKNLETVKMFLPSVKWKQKIKRQLKKINKKYKNIKKISSRPSASLK